MGLALWTSRGTGGGTGGTRVGRAGAVLAVAHLPAPASWPRGCIPSGHNLEDANVTRFAACAALLIVTATAAAGCESSDGKDVAAVESTLRFDADGHARIEHRLLDTVHTDKSCGFGTVALYAALNGALQGGRLCIDMRGVPLASLVALDLSEVPRIACESRGGEQVASGANCYQVGVWADDMRSGEAAQEALRQWLRVVLSAPTTRHAGVTERPAPMVASQVCALPADARGAAEASCDVLLPIQ